METNKRLTDAGLLDFLLRDREHEVFTNNKEISICFFESGKVTIGYVLKEQIDDDMRALRLWYMV